MRIFGIPVYYDPDTIEMAIAKGVWPFKRIIVGPLWTTLDLDERMGVLMHEAKHCLGFHLEIKLLLLPLMWTRWVLLVCHQQEMDADAFAIEQGHGRGLLRVITRFRHADEYYPSFDERYDAMIERINRQENHHALA